MERTHIGISEKQNAPPSVIISPFRRGGSRVAFLLGLSVCGICIQKNLKIKNLFKPALKSDKGLQDRKPI